MKSVTNNSSSSSNTSNNNNNWLGFSLSPHMTSTTMESNQTNDHQTHHSHTHTQTHPSPSFYPYASSVSSAFCYGFEPTNAPYYSHLSSMPLKSDGSLCIMEALSRSEESTIHEPGMVPSPPPKLEDFLGGTQNQYGTSTGTNEREAMALTLDGTSVYYSDHHGTEHQQIPFLQPLHQDISHMLNVPHEMYHGSIVEDPMNHSDHIVSSYKNNWSAMGYGDLHSLSLSMSSNSQSSCVTAMQNGVNQNASNEYNHNAVIDGSRKRGSEKGGTKQPVHRKSIDTFGQRTSQYRGVTRHRWTGRYEAHLWDNSCKKEGQTRKGRQGTIACYFCVLVLQSYEIMY
ncbi:hypothetical protein LUZ60_010411 [Juncus effusus]|nr:hypothetical protein LUZ60_010411 [Juncus effusus]